MENRNAETITLQQLTFAQAATQFPGCDTQETKDLVAEGRVSDLEPDYLRFFLYQGRLLSCVYEISYLGWSEWRDGDTWHDLDNVDWELDSRLDVADLVFLPPIA